MKTPRKRKRILTVWNKGYYCPEASNHLGTRKHREIVERALAEDLIELHEDTAFDEDSTWRAIAGVHDPAYVEAVRTGEPRSLAESQSFSWSPKLAQAVALIWSGHLLACRLALKSGLAFHPASGAHHATRAKGGGFCTFNDLVGSGRTLVADGTLSRVLIVDLDTHQGNGTWDLAKEDPRIALYDISGASFEVPEVETDRLFFRLVRGAESYFRMLEKLPQLLSSFRPELVQYLAGMDCHQHDDMGGIPGMTAERLAERDGFVLEAARQARVPLVLSPAGGYQKTGATVRLHLQTLRIAGGVDPREAVDSGIDSLALPNTRTYRCVLRSRDGSVFGTTPWTGEPPNVLFAPAVGNPTAFPNPRARRFERTQYRPRVLLVVYEEKN